MLKSKLIEYIQNNIDNYGDGEIYIEMSEWECEEGTLHEIIDVVNSSNNINSIITSVERVHINEIN